MRPGGSAGAIPGLDAAFEARDDVGEGVDLVMDAFGGGDHGFALGRELREARRSVEQADTEELVSLSIDDADRELFAVRASGTSMEGGKQPLHDGDWAVMRLARSMPAGAFEGRVVLVQVDSDAHGAGYQIKRLKRDGHGWQLTSDNPAGPTFTATESMVPIARLERSVRPGDLAPAVGTVYDEAEPNSPASPHGRLRPHSCSRSATRQAGCTSAWPARPRTTAPGHYPPSTSPRGGHGQGT